MDMNLDLDLVYVPKLAPLLSLARMVYIAM
jgi:hypothetical protein